MSGSKIIIADDGYNQFQYIFICDELGFGFFWFGFILEVLTEIEIFGLYYHLFVVEINLYVLHGGTGQLYFVGDLLAAVGGGVAAVEAEVYVLCAYTLSVEGLELWLFAGVVFDYGDVSDFLFTPDLMFGVYLLGFWLLFRFLFGFRLELFPNFSLYFGIGFCNLFLLLVCSNCGRVEDTALVRVIYEIIILFSCDELFESHHRVIVHHVFKQLQGLIRVSWQDMLCLCYNCNKTMKGRNGSIRAGKREVGSPKDTLSHMRTTSIKSNRMANLSKVLPSAKFYEKMLTQTTSSKLKQSRTISPRKESGSKAKGSKGASMGKGGSVVKERGVGKMRMVQSLNMPSLEPLGAEEFVRNFSQQLSTNTFDHSMLMATPFSEMLNRTQKTLEKYERTCGSLRKQQKQAQRELMQARQYIGALERQLARRCKEL